MMMMLLFMMMLSVMTVTPHHQFLLSIKCRLKLVVR